MSFASAIMHDLNIYVILGRMPHGFCFFKLFFFTTCKLIIQKHEITMHTEDMIV